MTINIVEFLGAFLYSVQRYHSNGEHIDTLRITCVLTHHSIGWNHTAPTLSRLSIWILLKTTCHLNIQNYWKHFKLFSSLYDMMWLPEARTSFSLHIYYWWSVDKPVLLSRLCSRKKSDEFWLGLVNI